MIVELCRTRDEMRGEEHYRKRTEKESLKNTSRDTSLVVSAISRTVSHPPMIIHRALSLWSFAISRTRPPSPTFGGTSPRCGSRSSLFQPGTCPRRRYANDSDSPIVDEMGEGEGWRYYDENQRRWLRSPPLVAANISFFSCFVFVFFIFNRVHRRKVFTVNSRRPPSTSR